MVQGGYLFPLPDLDYLLPAQAGDEASDGRTALHEAAQGRHAEACEVLLAGGAAVGALVERFDTEPFSDFSAK